MYVPVRHQFTGGINKYLSAAQLVVNEPTVATLLACARLGACVHLAIAVECSRLHQPLPKLVGIQCVQTSLGLSFQLAVLGNVVCNKREENDLGVILQQVVARLVVQVPYDALELELSSSIVLVTCN